MKDENHCYSDMRGRNNVRIKRIPEALQRNLGMIIILWF
jgi:hypothetical protein